MRPLIALALLAAAAPRAAAEDAPAKKWKDSAEVSFVNTNGNSKTQTTSGKDLFSYAFSARTALDVDGGGLGSKNNGVVSAEQYFAGEKTTQKFDDHDYVFEKYRWNRDRFAGVAHRHEISVGAGRELWKGKADLLTAEAAPGYFNEQRFNDERKSYASSRAYSKYTHDFSATARFSQDVEWVQSLADKRDSRFGTETALTAALSGAFSIKNSFAWKHDSRPPAGKTKNDETAAVALLAAF